MSSALALARCDPSPALRLARVTIKATTKEDGQQRVYRVTPVGLAAHLDTVLGTGIPYTLIELTPDDGQWSTVIYL